MLGRAATLPTAPLQSYRTVKASLPNAVNKPLFEASLVLPGQAREGVQEILSFLRWNGVHGQSGHTALGTLVTRSEWSVGTDKPAYRFPTGACLYLGPYRCAHDLR